MNMSILQNEKLKRFMLAIVVFLGSGVGFYFDVPNAKADSTCSITVGENGQSWTFKASLPEPGQMSIQLEKPARFVRSTSGPCLFTIYNDNFEGRYVTLGSGLNKKIRAGIGGVDGTGATWKIRSISIKRVSDSSCQLRLGGKGVRMTYYPAKRYDRPYDRVPAMNRISYLRGTGCIARLYSDINFNRDGGRSIDVHPFDHNKTYDIGFRVRSIEFD